MAIASWLTLSKTSGQGSADVVLSVGEYWGRNDRSTTGKVTTAGGVTQNFSVAVPGREAFVSLDETEISILSVPATGDSSETILIEGYSNGKNLHFTSPAFGTVFANDGFNIFVNEDASPTQTGGVDFDKDYGANDRYRFKIKLEVNNNTLANARSTYIDFTANYGEADQSDTVRVTITQQGAASTLALDNNSFNLPSDGGEATMKITSNDSWEIS